MRDFPFSKPAHAICFPLLFLFATLHVAFSQGEFIKRSENAFGLAVSLSSSKAGGSAGGSAAISALGTFDLGLSYSFLFVEGSNDIRAIAPFASLHLIKQDQTFPASLSAHGSLQKYSSTKEGSSSFSTWSYGGSAFRMIALSERIALQPILTVTSTKAVLFETWREKRPAIISYSLSVSFISQAQNTNRFFAQPALILSETEPAFSIAIGLVGLLSK